MSRAARDFLVYACEGCGKRIFTDPTYVGRRGRCPLCGVKHTVGGPVTAEPADDRRAAPRVKPAHTRVELKRHRSSAAHRDDLLAQELHPLEDLSETGVGFLLPGRRDTRRLSGVAPPPLEVGDMVQVTLHFGGMERPRVYQAEVKRVERPDFDGRAFLVGAQFTGLTPVQADELRRLVRRQLERDR